MTPKIKPADLEKTVYKVAGGGYFEADGTVSPYDKLGIRVSNIPKASNGQPVKATDENKHFVQDFNPLSFSLKEVGDTKVLNFGPPGEIDKIVYLPYYQKNITSTEIPINDASVCYFITDELSGCNFFIDKLPNGNLVCHHANALQYSPTADEVKADAGAFHPLAPTTMDTQHSTALIAYPHANTVARLRVADYYANAQASADRKVAQGRTDVEFYGGTTIMGFRVAGQWEFWFQTYTRLSYRRTGIAGLIKGKEVKVGDAPHKIIEARRFWP